MGVIKVWEGLGEPSHLQVGGGIWGAIVTRKGLGFCRCEEQFRGAIGVKRRVGCCRCQQEFRMLQAWQGWVCGWHEQLFGGVVGVGRGLGCDRPGQSIGVLRV